MQKKTRQCGGEISGGTTGTRTLDPMIKSHLLYQLSYGPMDPESNRVNAIFRWFGANFDIIKTKMQEKMQKIVLLFPAPRPHQTRFGVVL